MTVLPPRALPARLYVWTTAATFAALLALTIYSWWPFYPKGVQGAFSLGFGLLCYGGWMTASLLAVSRLTRMVAGRGLGRGIVVCHLVALALAAMLVGAITALSWQRARADPIQGDVDYSTVGDGAYYIGAALGTIVTYETLLIGCLLVLEAISWLRHGPRRSLVPAAPVSVFGPSATAPPATAVARAQRDSMGTSIGIVTGVAGLGLGFNGNYTTAAVSIGVGLAALLVVYLIGGRLRN